VAGIQVHLSRGVLVLLALCLLALGYLAYDYHEQTSLLDDAEAVEATVLDTDIEEVGRRGASRYQPVVEYEYEYGGSTYTSDTVFPGSFERTYSSESDAREVLEPYETDSTVTAQVDPSDPETAFLERTTTDQPIWYGGLVVGLLALTVLHAIGPRDVGRVDLRPAGAEQRHERLFGVDRATVYTYSKRYTRRGFAIAFVLLCLLVVFIAVAEGLSAPVDTDPGLGVVLSVLAITYAVLVGSVFAYAAWSFTEYRRLRDRIAGPKPPSPFAHPSRLVSILERSVRTSGDETDGYGNRVGWTALAVALGVFLVALPTLVLV